MPGLQEKRHEPSCTASLFQTPSRRAGHRSRADPERHATRARFVRRGRHRARSGQPGAEHHDRCAHVGADQQPDPPAAERGADADQPGAQSGEPAVQRGQSPALDAGHDAAIDRPGPGPGLPGVEPRRRVRPPLPRAVRRHRERQPDVPGRAPALEKHAQWPADRHADAGPGVSEPEPGRRRSGRPGQPEPVGHRSAAGHAGHQLSCWPCRPSSPSSRSS